MGPQEILYVIKARNEAKKAGKEFADDMKRSGTNTKKIGDEARKAAKETDKVARAGKEAKTELTLAAKASKALKGSLAGVGASLIAAFAVGSIIAGSVTAARDFNSALAETSTLIEGTPEQLDQITASTDDLIRAFGGSGAGQISSFYQAISAGASDIANATEIVTQANKLAIGGVTDVKTGVDILTTVVNAYGADVITAEQASDSLFVAMKAGKTTVGELASTMGNVIPIANAAGVGFDQLAAAVSALTTQGIKTSVATTNLKAILSGIVKPTSEAVEVAKRLGIDFSLTALKAKGLKDFLLDLKAATNGNIGDMAQLFGSVEALGGVLALTGGGAKAFEDTLEAMRNKTGETQLAFDKISAMLDQRLTVSLDRIAKVLTDFGSLLLRVIVPAMEAAAFVMEVLSDNAEALGVVMVLIAIKQLPLLITGLTSVSRVAFVAVSSFTTLGAGMATMGVRATVAAVGVKAFSFALRAIPLVAVLSLLSSGLSRWQAATAATKVYKEQLETIEPVLESLKVALAAFNKDVSNETEDALRASARTTVGGLKEAIAAAKVELENLAPSAFTLGSFLPDFGTNVGSIKRVKEELAGLEAALAAAEGTLGSVTVSMADLDVSFKAFVTSGTRETAEAFARTASLAVEQLGLSLADAKAVAAQDFGFVAQLEFDVFGTGAIAEAQKLVKSLNKDLDKAKLALKLADEQVAFQKTIPTIKELAQEIKEVGKSTFEVVPAADALRDAYGAMTGTMLEVVALQNEFARINGELTLNNLISEISVAFDATEKTKEELLALNTQLLEVKNADGFGNQARAALQLAQNIVQAAGSTRNLTDEEQKAVELLTQAAREAIELEKGANDAARAIGGAASNAGTLVFNLKGAVDAINKVNQAAGSVSFDTIGIEAQNKALLAGKSAIEAQSAARIAQRAEELKGTAQGPAGVSDAAKQSLIDFINIENKSVIAKTNLKATQDAINASTKAGSAATKSAGSDTAAFTDLLDSLNQKWADNAAVVGLTRQEAEDYKLTQELINAATEQGITLTQANIEGILATRDAYEQAGMAQDTFLAGAKQGWEDFSESAQTNAEFAASFTKNAFNGLSGVISDFVTTGKADFKGLIIDLLSQISSFLASQLLQSFMKSFGGGAGGGGGGGIVGAITSGIGAIFGAADGARFAVGQANSIKRGNAAFPKFADGGNFLVGGSGGVDSQLVQFMASPNERVSIQRPEQVQGGGAPISVSFNFPNADANSFQKSEGQISARMARIMDNANKRNN